MNSKKTIHFFAIISGISLLLSCVNHVKETSQQWNPYTEYDKLEFVSDHGEHSSIQITEIATSEDNGNELISINALFELKGKNAANNTFAKTFLLAMTANPDGDDYFSFNILSPDQEFFSYPAIKLSKLESMQTSTVILAEKTYNDVLQLNQSTFQPENPQTANINKINTLLWSKKEGLLQYTTQSGETWTLNNKTHKITE
jgi:hypothetical protein